MRRKILLLFFFISRSLFAGHSSIEMDCPQDRISEKVPWRNRMRLIALNNVDEFLNWSLSPSLRSYALQELVKMTTYRDPIRGMREFNCLHGYFSLFRPLLGKVSKNREDLDIMRECFLMIDQKMTNPELKRLATAEILSKVLAYRDLRMGDRFAFTSQDLDGNDFLASYQVSRIFNLWHGMPAFGLIPDGKGAPILLFRGTDFSLDSQRGWASLMSDVDPGGSGLFAFEHAQPQIRAWLKAVSEMHGKVRVLGFSLGGTLAAYTFIFENEWMSDEPSFGFNLPGVSEKVLKKWNTLSSTRQACFMSYVNRGDSVSKVGNLFGSVYEFSIGVPMKPVTAHTRLITADRIFFQMAVDVEQENQSRHAH